MAKFVLRIAEFNDYDTDKIGVSKDNWLDEQNQDSNHGTDDYIRYRFIDLATNKENHPVIEITMPDEEDIDGFDSLFKVELELYLSSMSIPIGASGVRTALYLIEIDDDWDEQIVGSAHIYSNWNFARELVPWKKAEGATASKNLDDGSGVSGDDTVVATKGFIVSGSSILQWYSFDITDYISIGEKKSFVMIAADTEAIVGTDDSVTLDFRSRHYSVNPDQRPNLKITYKDRPPDAFQSKDDKLTIEPYVNNPEQPHLKWGEIGDENDFSAWKIYRETTLITSVTSLTPIATISDMAVTEYIDDDTLINGTTYYYLIVAEDSVNTGNDGTFSKNIIFTKPDVVDATLHRADGSPWTGIIDVGTQVYINTTSFSKIKRFWADWKDGIESWYEFDIVEHFQDAYHIYSDDSGGAVTPDVRVEDELGFWSSVVAADDTVDVNDTTPLAKLLINVKRDHVGVEITLNAALSQPAGSNVTITSYKFWRYATDPAPVTQSSPIFSFSTTGYSVGTETAKVEITTSTSLTSIDTVNYDLESGDPVELVFSRNTRIHEIPHDLTLEKDWRAPLEGEGIEYQFKSSRRAERISVHGTSHTPDMDIDIGIIRDVWENDTYFRVRVKNEVEGKDVLYDGKLESDVTLGHSYPNLITWSFNMVVFNRTEV